MNNWNFTIPKTDLDSSKMMILGNFIAEKATGFYNGNKTTWHVYEVEWIIGEFEKHQNYECDLATKVINHQKYESKSVRSTGLTCFVTVKDIANTNKQTARKLMKEHHEQKGITVAWSESENESGFRKHEVK